MLHPLPRSETFPGSSRLLLATEDGIFLWPGIPIAKRCCCGTEFERLDAIADSLRALLEPSQDGDAIAEALEAAAATGVAAATGAAAAGRGAAAAKDDALSVSAARNAKRHMGAKSSEGLCGITAPSSPPHPTRAGAPSDDLASCAGTRAARRVRRAAT